MCLTSVCPLVVVVAGVMVCLGLSSGGGRGWRDGVSWLSSSWFLREEV